MTLSIGLALALDSDSLIVTARAAARDVLPHVYRHCPRGSVAAAAVIILLATAATRSG